MLNSTGFMNFPNETAAAFPSRTVAAFPLSSTVQPSLVPLTVSDPWALAVAVRPTTTLDASAILVTTAGGHNSGQHHVCHLD